mmetsp:Transcript_42237/g.105480  ORF Transcript_42237/g.105480 Transcript_42237/m.105480 type:complete len:274 (+) Transcript_42237:234-1055(+)
MGKSPWTPVCPSIHPSIDCTPHPTTHSFTSSLPPSLPTAVVAAFSVRLLLVCIRCRPWRRRLLLLLFLLLLGRGRGWGLVQHIDIRLLPRQRPRPALLFLQILQDAQRQEDNPHRLLKHGLLDWRPNLVASRARDHFLQLEPPEVESPPVGLHDVCHEGAELLLKRNRELTRRLAQLRPSDGLQGQEDQRHPYRPQLGLIWHQRPFDGWLVDSGDLQKQRRHVEPLLVRRYHGSDELTQRLLVVQISPAAGSDEGLLNRLRHLVSPPSALRQQ